MMRTYAQYQSLIEEALPNALPEAQGPGARALEAARYSLLAGGKRLRGVLLLAACEYAGGDVEKAMSAACAMECLHAYSLIHDDLPAMDNDDMRRGKPSCHKAFGEDMAILAGDGLNSHAFLLMTMGMMEDPGNAAGHVGAMYQIGLAAGFLGMVGGQSADIAADGQEMSKDTLGYIQAHKTAALIRAALLAGLSIGGCKAQEVFDAFTNYGGQLGLAFQVADDILDATASPQELGKTPGKDEAAGKLSSVALFGLNGARARLSQLSSSAKLALGSYAAQAQFFLDLADSLAVRKG